MNHPTPPTPPHTAGDKRQPPVPPVTAGSVSWQLSGFGFRAPALVLNWILNQSLYKIVLVILCCILFTSACIYIFIYLFIYLVFSFTIVLYVCYLLWNDFMCILLYMIMYMLLSATNTHFKWEIMLYFLHCPTLNKVFLLLLLLLLLPTPQPPTQPPPTTTPNHPPPPPPKPHPQTPPPNPNPNPRPQPPHPTPIAHTPTPPFPILLYFVRHLSTPQGAGSASTWAFTISEVQKKNWSEFSKATESRLTTSPSTPCAPSWSTPKSKTPGHKKWGVVYEIQCLECLAQYVADTARTLETGMKDRPPQTEVSTNSCGRPWTSHQNGQSQSDRPRAQYVATQDPWVHWPAVMWLWGINLIHLI